MEFPPREVEESPKPPNRSHDRQSRPPVPRRKNREVLELAGNAARDNKKESYCAKAYSACPLPRYASPLTHVLAPITADFLRLPHNEPVPVFTPASLTLTLLGSTLALGGSMA
ncbi:hypothetical protein SDJN02_16031, partial [Cucurbita argyrosperma subsp. argyrosperma]